MQAIRSPRGPLSASTIAFRILSALTCVWAVAASGCGDSGVSSSSGGTAGAGGSPTSSGGSAGSAAGGASGSAGSATGGGTSSGGSAGSGGTGGTGGGRGSVCNSLAPVFSTMPKLTTAAEALYTYDAAATDPEGKPVTFFVSSDKAISVAPSTGIVKWVPSAADTGKHSVTLTASDPSGCTAVQTFEIDVLPANHAPEIVSEAPFLAHVGQAYQYQVVAEDADGDMLAYELMGEPAGMTISTAGLVTWTPSAAAAGTHDITVVVSDPAGASDKQMYTLAVGSGSGGAPPIVDITSPSALDEVAGFAALTGTVSDTDLLIYFIDVCNEDGIGCEPVFESTSPVQNGAIGKADTGGIENGIAVLRVRAYDKAGNSTMAERMVRVGGGLKLGSVDLSLLDFEVEAPGIPLRVVRTYSSLRRREKGSFGFGWQLDIADGYRLERSRPEAEGWLAEISGFLNVTVTETGDPHYFVLQTPGREVHAFGFVPNMVYGGIGLFSVTPDYFDVLQKGDTMTPTFPPGDLIYPNTGVEELITDDNFTPYAPTAYTITTGEGMQYDLDRKKGLTQIRDSNNNSVTISDSGIVHSNGRSLQIQRDGEGRVSKITTPTGGVMTYTYDAKGNLTKVQKPEGVTETYTYHTGHLLFDVVGADGSLITRKEYDDRGRLVHEINGEGRERSYSYDDAQGTQTVTEGSAGKTLIKYGPRGEVESFENEAGDKTVMAYDAKGNMTSKVDPTGATSTFAYDFAGNLTTMTAPHAAGAPPSSYTTTMAYDANGRLTKTTLPSGAQLVTTYTPNGKVAEVRDESNSVIAAYQYAPSGEISASIDSLSGVSNFGHNGQGDVTSYTDPYGVTTGVTVDQNGDLKTLQEPGGMPGDITYDGLRRKKTQSYAGITAQYEYGTGSGEWTKLDSPTTGKLSRKLSVDGQVKEYEGPLGDQRTLAYDDAGRLAASVDQLGRVTTYEFGKGTHLSSATFPDGTKVSYERDAVGRVTKETSPDGNATTLTYEIDGKPSTVSDPLGNTVTFTYTPTSITTTDPLQRKTVELLSPQGLTTQVVYPDQTSVQFQYLGTSRVQDAEEWPTAIIDEAGRTRSFGYDSMARRTTSTDLSGKSYSITYTGDQPATMTSPGGEQITWTYDNLSRLQKLKHADGVEWVYSYGQDSQPTQAARSDGTTITTTYDINGKPLSKTASDGEDRSFTYDLGARLLSSNSSTGGDSSFGYDLMDRLIEKAGPDGWKIAYEHDAAGRTTAVIVEPKPGAPTQRTDYAYDAAGRLVSIKDPLGGITTLSYDKASRRTQRLLPNGVVTKYTYDDRDRLIGVVHEKNGAPLRTAQYQRAASGEPTSVTYDDGTVGLAYDSALRLTGETHGGSSSAALTYGYDIDGKRTSVTGPSGTTSYTYGAGYRLDSTAGGGNDSSIGYDAAGRTVSIQRSGQTTQIEYSSFDTVKSVTTASGTTTYDHDASGVRVRAQGPDGARRFIAGPAMGDGLPVPYGIADQNGALLMTYVYAGPSPVLRIGADGKPVYYLEDALGSVIALADEAGAKVATFRYDAFGNALASSGAQADAPGPAGGDYRFHGAWLEKSSGLYHMRARDYDSVTGRFLIKDPAPVDVSEPEGMHAYAFANHNPMLFADPTGAFAIVSVNISMNFETAMQNIQTAAVNSIKAELRDKIEELVIRIVLEMVLPGFFDIKGIEPILEALQAGGTGAHGDAFAGWVSKQVCKLAGNSLDWVSFAVVLRQNGDVAFNGFNCHTNNKKNLQKRNTTKDPVTGLNLGDLNEADFVLGDKKPDQGGAWMVGDFKAKSSTIKINSTQVAAMGNYARRYGMHIVAYVVWIVDTGKVWKTQLELRAITLGCQITVLGMRKK